LEFRSLAIAEIVSYTVGYGGIGVPLAHKGFGVWSLVISSLSQGALSAILSYTFSRHNLSLIYRWKYYKQLYSFGGRVSFISFLEFIGSQLDKLAIGHFLGANPLGIYDRAFLTANLPASSFSVSISKVLFPVFSRIQTEIERLRKSYLATIMLVAAIIVPTCLGISAASDEIVKVLLGEKWTEAVPVLRILSIAAAFNFLSLFGGVLCDATATLNVKIVIQLGYVLCLGVAFYLVAPLGLMGFAIAVAVGEFIRHSAYVIVTKRVFKTRAKELLSFYVPALTAGVIVGAVIYAVSIFARQAQWSVVFALSVEMCFGFVFLVYFFFFNRRQPVQKEIVARITSSGLLSNRASAAASILRWFCRRSITT
jgi:lipopolysaccharide exporter